MEVSIVIDYDGDDIEDEDVDELLDYNERKLIDIALQLSQQSKANTIESATTNKLLIHLDRHELQHC